MTTQVEHWLKQASYQDEFRALMPFESSDLRDRLLAQLVEAVRDPKLSKCDPRSIFLCCKKAALLGLELNTPANLISAVPFNGSAVPIVEYRGLAALMRRYGGVKAIHTGIVRQNDEYSRTATDFSFKCDPFLAAEKRGEIIGAFCFLDVVSGLQVETMSVEEIEHVRQKSRAKAAGPWVTDWAQMARKTVLRRAANLVDWSPKAANLISQVDRTEFHFEEEEADVEVKKPARGNVAVREHLRRAPAYNFAADSADSADDSDFSSNSNSDPSSSNGSLTPEQEGRLHLSMARKICTKFELLKPWDRITAPRRQMVDDRMSDLGLVDDIPGFWRTVEKLLESQPKDKVKRLALDQWIEVAPDGETDVLRGPYQEALLCLSSSSSSGTGSTEPESPSSGSFSSAPAESSGPISKLETLPF